jgi:diadenosine tetraphosphate (Ap4A) HIT family hydrolase
MAVAGKTGSYNGSSSPGTGYPMNDTLFGRIIRREIPATIVYEDDDILGFKDIAPQAPVHVLFVPKGAVIPTLDDATPEQAALLGRLMLAAAEYARREGFAGDGYRVVMNCREHAGQTVFHVHLHLLAGAPLGHFGTP